MGHSLVFCGRLLVLRGHRPRRGAVLRRRHRVHGGRVGVAAGRRGGYLDGGWFFSSELIAELIATFVTDTNDVGTGTVVGSAVFNHLIIIGGAILASPGQRMTLDPRALIRDVGFYAVTIVVLVLVFRDGKVETAEAWTMLILYIFYVFLCAIWTCIEKRILPASLGKAEKQVVVELGCQSDVTMLWENSREE